jgi:hypothetical protein
MKNSANINSLRIATPCPIGWEQMAGDNRVRFCDHCHLNVYNISELSQSEAEKLIASTEGRICARLFRRADGTILTKDCPVGLRALKRRVTKKATAAFAAIVSLSGAVFGQQSSTKNGKTDCTPQTRITRTNASQDSAGKKVLSGTVLDPIGAVVPRANVTVTKTGTKEKLQALTNDKGIFEFSVVPEGIYSITIEGFGFKSLVVENVEVEKDKLLNLSMILEPSLGETIGVMTDTSYLIVPPAGTTIFNERMIRSLPLPK